VHEFKNQVELFRWVWENRPHRSEISGDPLGYEMNAWFFAHVLPKGSYRLSKLDHKNIVLMTPEEHTLYDHQTDKARKDVRYDWLFLYREHLTRQYYDVHYNQRNRFNRR
jgi:hypothetical protein